MTPDSLNPPTINTDDFWKKLVGPKGSMGKSENGGVDIHYVLATIGVGDFDSVGLISQIQGSEKWKIPQLFQRDVNKGNVERIKDWLKENDGYKFFNPLTLTLLPTDQGGELDLDIPNSLTPEDGWFKLEDHEGWGVLSFDSGRGKLVAIDGQHRFTALKDLRASSQVMAKRMSGWRIPVVIFVPLIPEPEEGKKVPSWIDISRQVFYNINTKSNEVSEQRKILLNNNDINTIATQEFLQVFHQNDYQDLTKRNDSLLPLYLFEWRDPNEETVPATLFKTKEIHDCLKLLILGPKTADAELALQLLPGDPIQAAISNEATWAHETAEDARELLANDFIPGLTSLISNLPPLEALTNKYRKQERIELGNDHDATEFAFRKFRYGVQGGGDDASAAFLNQATNRSHEIRNEFADIPSDTLPRIFANDIGLRGVFSAYAQLRTIVGTVMKNAPESWKDYSEWFVDAVKLTRDNDAGNGEEYSPKQWPLFILPNTDDSDYRPTTNQKFYAKALRHLAFDHNESVGGGLYRFENIKGGIGAIYALIILSAKYQNDKEAFHDDKYNSYVDKALDILEGKQLLNGYKKECRPAVKQLLNSKAPNGEALPTDIRKKTQKEAEKKATSQIGHIRSLILSVD